MRIFARRLLLGLLIIGSCLTVCAQENLPDLENRSASVLNEELRKLRADVRNANSDILAVIPSGVIVMWHGTVATIPSGWALCDGNNGTPDLRNRFIVCADADDGGVAKTTLTGGATQSGGSISHDHTGSCASHTHQLTLSQRNKDETGTLEGHAVVNTATGDTAPAITVNSESAPQPYYALALIMKL
jgi:hypothetical protein